MWPRTTNIRRAALFQIRANALYILTLRFFCPSTVDSQLAFCRLFRSLRGLLDRGIVDISRPRKTTPRPSADMRPMLPLKIFPRVLLQIYS